ncbi:hypothetical protein [Chryseobacterium sp.]|uniref:hypothetical protein n=1 Tax=Chryseobacterium sp. TaxID=1871047 RepID=UPI0028966C34|nr:hypothetical protein [Chryseobacterium sp.]
MKPPKILCIHGIGGKDATIDKWSHDWRKALKKHLNITEDNYVKFMKFDGFFSGYNANPADYGKFIARAFLDFLGLNKSEKMLGRNWLDDYPDMVVEFMQEPQLRYDLRKELKKYLIEFKPDIIYAHSLGSLMCYDFFLQDENKAGYHETTLVTAGSQLGNKLIQSSFPIVDLPVRNWYNLNNENDIVFACRDILSTYPNFKQIETSFKEGFINHDGFRYLDHPKTVSEVWSLFK